MIFADAGLPEIPTSVFGLLAFMVVTFLVGIGWVGRVFFTELRWAVRRLLGEAVDDVLEKYTKRGNVTAN